MSNLESEQLEVRSSKERLKETIKVLLVDDDTQFLDLAGRYLEKQDDRIESVKCETPEEALELLEDDDFDCILSDYDMPVMNGIELLEEVHLRWPDIPFILVTGEGDEDVASEAIRKGVADYFKKSSITDQFSIIVNRIENVISKRQTEKGKEEAIEKLRSSQEKYELLLQNLPDGAAAVFDKDLVYTLVGGEIVKDSGLEPDDLRGEHVSTIYEGADLEKIKKNYKAALKGEKRRFTVEVKDRTLRVVTSPIKEGGEIVFGLALSYDITDLKQQEDKLEEKLNRNQELVDSLENEKNKLSAVLNNLPVGVWITDENGKMIRKNKKADEIWGGDAPLAETPGEYTEYKTWNDNGERLDTDDYPISKVLRTGQEDVSSQFQIERFDGTKAWILASTSPILDENDEMSGAVSISLDITKRKEREERLEDFGNLLSHDLRNPLDIAKGYLDLVEDPGSENEELIQETKDAVYRAVKVVEDLKIIAVNPENIEKEEVNLKEAFGEALESVELAPESYEIDDRTVEARRDSIIQLFANLIQNSVEHNSKPVSITVGSLENGFYFEDDGEGIPDEDLDRIMEKGFTTAEKGQGLGLYIIGRIAELHEWSIEVTESETGGARFEFRL